MDGRFLRYELRTQDPDAASAFYRRVLGRDVWPSELPARTHPHWLFFFRVPDLDRALERVRGAGGIALPVVEDARGARLAACDDPQGAAFGLYADT